MLNSSTADETRRMYEIVVKGEFGELLAAAFAELTVRPANGQTVLIAPVINAAELYGILDRLQDFAIEIIGLSEFGEG